MFVFDEKHLAAAVLHPLYRRLTFASTYSKGIAHTYIRQEIDNVLGVNHQDQSSIVELAKKKHKSMEDQFADPEDVDISDDIDLVSATSSKNDELNKYLRMNIDDAYKQLDPLLFWKDHQSKLCSCAVIAKQVSLCRSV